MGIPYTQFEKSINKYSNTKPSPAKFYRQQLLILLILLIIPAINLTSMTHSRLHRYISEIGVRRAFGCRRSQIIKDIVAENLVLSVIAGLVGLLLCAVFVYFCSNALFAKDWISNNGRSTVEFSTLFNPIIFLFAFIFCFILNLMSSIVPAWQASCTNIVNAINGRTR
jgi:putative ABC transport system permease protein